MRASSTSARSSGPAFEGSHRRSAVESTTGSEPSTERWPSSVSSRARNRTPSSSSSRTPGANGRPRSSATSGPTWPVSASNEFRPHSTRSNGPSAVMAAARARAVARVSEPAKRGSQRWTPRVAPQASISRSAAAAVGGPIVNTMTSPSGPASSTALAFARRQNALTSSSTPSRTRRPSSRRSSSGLGTCLTSTAMRIGYRILSLPGRRQGGARAGDGQRQGRRGQGR